MWAQTRKQNMLLYDANTYEMRHTASFAVCRQVFPYASRHGRMLHTPACHANTTDFPCRGINGPSQ